MSEITYVKLTSKSFKSIKISCMHLRLLSFLSLTLIWSCFHMWRGLGSCRSDTHNHWNPCSHAIVCSCWQYVIGTRLLTVLRRFECIDCSRTVQLPPVQSVYLRQHNDVRLLLPTLWPDQVHPVRILGPSRDVCHMSRAFLSIWNCMGPDQWLLQLPYLHRIQ